MSSLTLVNPSQPFGAAPVSQRHDGPVARWEDLACDLLSRGHGIRFRAPGQSMHPTIRDGEAIRVLPVLPARIRRGDILLYRWERGVRAHRVTRIERAGQGGLEFIIRGDAGGEDERIPAEEVLGRVVSLERDGRRIGLRGPAALARRAVRRSASRMKRLVANPRRWLPATVGAARR